MDFQKISHLASSAVQNILQLHAKYSPVSHYFSSAIGKLLLSNSILIHIRTFPHPQQADCLARTHASSPAPVHTSICVSLFPGRPWPEGQGQPDSPSFSLWQAAGAARPPALPCRPAHCTQPESLLLPPRENGLLTTRAGQDGGSHRSQEVPQPGLKQQRQRSQNLESCTWPLPYSQPMDVSLLPWCCNTRSFKDHASSPSSFDLEPLMTHSFQDIT